MIHSLTFFNIDVNSVVALDIYLFFGKAANISLEQMPSSAIYMHIDSFKLLFLIVLSVIRDIPTPALVRARLVIV